MAAILVAGLAAGLALALTGGSDDSASEPNARSGLQRVATLAAKYAPIVRLHPDERFFPVSAEEFLAHSSLVFFRKGQAAERVADAPDAVLLGNGGYRSGTFPTNALTRPFTERLAGVDLDPHDGFVLDLADESHCGRSEAIGCTFAPAPVYYQYSPGRYLTYWFFYPYSAPPGFNGKPSFRFGHEGDWERVAILLDEQDRPQAVSYFQHEGPPALVTWQSASALVGGSRRPVVYGALGTHASYAQAGAKTVTLGYLHGANTPSRPQATFVERRADGFEWESWHDLRDVESEWFGYGGAWGNRGRFPFTTGPLGPSKWKAPAPCTPRIGEPCFSMTEPQAARPFAAA